MSACCEDDELEVLDDGVVVSQQVTKLSFDGGIAATQDPGDPDLVHVSLGGPGAVSLQIAYEGGEVITTDAQGAVDLIRGILTPDGESLLTLADANANPGRTVSLLAIDDSNVVGAVVAGVAVSVQSIARDNVTNTPVWTRWLSTADNPSGPIVELSLQRATPTAEDIAGHIRFVARDSALNVTLYAELRGVGERITNNIEIGRFDLLARFGNNNPKFLSFFARGAAAALDGGVIYGWLAAGANPAVEVRVLNNFAAGQPVFVVSDSDGGSPLIRVDGDGDAIVTNDIEAVGGYQKTIGIWTSALIANQTDVALVLAATIANDWTVFRAGSITGIATRLNAVVTAGTLTINVRVNGAIVFTSAVTAVTTVTTQAKDLDAIVATDLITVSYTSSALFAGPVTASVEVEIEE